MKLPPRAMLVCAVAARHFLVLLHFICMKISHGSMIYIIDEGSHSALQSLEQNFPWYAPPPTPPPLPPTPLLSFSHFTLSPFISPSICPPIGTLFHPSPVSFHPAPALWSLIILSFHKSNLTSLLPLIHPSFFHLCLPSPPYHGTSKWAQNMWPERWEPARPPPAVPPYVDLSPPVPYWFCFKQVKNTRRMRCQRWHEIK